jgi:hypothetical protein
VHSSGKDLKYVTGTEQDTWKSGKIMDRSSVYPGSHTDRSELGAAHKQRVHDSGLKRTKGVGQVPLLKRVQARVRVPEVQQG